MTKDWDAVQHEIKELSFGQRKPLEEVKELMERKYKFRASTRAYRMKLKEWGLMRHKTRNTTKGRNETERTKQRDSNEDEQCDKEYSATGEPMPASTTLKRHSAKPGDWQAVRDPPPLILDAVTVAEPTFMSLLSQPQDLQLSFDTWSRAPTQSSEIVLDMLVAVLDNDARNLERLILENVHHVNDPIGLPFDLPDGRLVGHPVMAQILIQQHPGQTLFDIACGMPCGPIIWILLAYGAKGSKHPFGTDLALHNAIKNGRVYTVQALLVPGRSDLEGPGNPWTPLVQAVFWNKPEVVRILLSRGANVNNRGTPGSSTALHVCLIRRENNYIDLSFREKCHRILEMLLSAGADVHVTLTHPVIHSSFGMFIEPWRRNPYWSIELPPQELDCLRLFMSKGINLEVSFQGCPCVSARSKTFIHQVLWHSTPSVARHFVDTFVASPANDGSLLLHEILTLCPNAKRHPTDTLRDIQVLLRKGVNPNLADASGLTPLRKCLEQCPAVDLVARLHMLLDGGADPEAEDSDGNQPYILAARTLEEPLLSEVMSALVAKIPGRHVRCVDGVTHIWAADHFPISETQVYSQVMSCVRRTDGFMLNMRNMVPEDIQSVFQRAYDNALSKNFLNTMTKVAQTKLLDSKEKSEVLSVISMRRGLDLMDYKFDQRLVEALLDLPHGT